MDLAELYQQELKLLKESSKVFSEEYPAITESLNRDILDPDVDMILQGVSYLTAQFKKELDEQFPVALQALSQALTPTLMQPIPAVSILSLAPKANLISPLTIKKGANFDSIPVKLDEDGQDKISCRFSSAWQVEVLPVRLTSLQVNHVDKHIKQTSQRVVELVGSFTSEKNDLANYTFDTLRFYINQPASDASIWLKMLAQNLQSIQISSNEGVSDISVEKLGLTGYSLGDNIFDGSSASNQHSILQEYYTVPEKLQFFELNLSQWQRRSGDNFSITFQFKQPSWSLPEITLQHLKLYCTPVVNEFEHFAEPAAMNGVQLDFPLTAQSRNVSTELLLPIVEVLSVESIKRERERNKKYQNIVKPKSTSSKSGGFYYYRKHGINDGEVANWLALEFEPGSRPESQEVLRVKLKCCHGEVAANLPPQQITQATSTSPELVTFTNLTTTTEYLPAQIIANEAWQVVSDQALSLQNVENAPQLKQVLRHHIPAQLKNTAKYKTLEHRINAITQLDMKAIDHLENGLLIRGSQFLVQLNSEHFINQGESFLFSALLNQLLALQVSINSFSQLGITESRSGELRLWPINFGGIAK
jgi:type VI secretion system protein ImpG